MARQTAERPARSRRLTRARTTITIASETKERLWGLLPRSPRRRAEEGAGALGHRCHARGNAPPIRCQCRRGTLVLSPTDATAGPARWRPGAEGLGEDSRRRLPPRATA